MCPYASESRKPRAWKWFLAILMAASPFVWGTPLSAQDASGDKVGLVIRYQIVKNKLAPDGNEGEFHILLKNGIFKERELIAQCLNLGILRFGGRGGRQVLLPTLDRETNDFVLDKDDEMVTTPMKQFDAARRLILDEALFSKLGELYTGMLNPGQHAVDNFLDEILDSETA